MRWLMWFGIGFGMSCAMGAYVFRAGISVGLVGVCAVGLLLCFLVGIRRRGWKAAGTVLLGCVMGFSWFGFYHGAVSAVAQRRDGMVRDAVITVSDYSYQTDYGYAAEGYIRMDGRIFSLRVYLEEPVELEPGDRLYGSFRFRYTQPREEERVSHYQGKGIFLLADRARNLRVVASGETQWWHYPARMARGIDAILAACFPEDVYPFARALLLGDSSQLDFNTDLDLRISGIRHIIAVSGLHVSMLYGIIRQITGRKRFLTALVGLPALCLFAAIAGFTPSVSRACLMVVLMMLSELVLKEYDAPTALSFACILMLTVNPMIISSVSFQLSVGSVAGILLFQVPLRDWLVSKLPSRGRKTDALKRWFSGSVAVTLSAMVFTTPLSACYFGMISLIGVVTNLLTLWVVTLVFAGILALCLLSLIWPQGAVWLGWLLAWPIRYILLAARLLSRVPLAAVSVSSVYVIFWLVFCYLLLALFLLGKRQAPALTATCACLGLCAALICSWAEPMLDDSRVTVLDVGQGQCILLQTEGKNYLVDCGSTQPEDAADALLRILFSQGIYRLDGVILTHCDQDHAGGIGYVLDRVKTDVLLLPATVPDFWPGQEGLQMIFVDRETILSFGDASVRIYPPVFSAVKNENSLCILFDSETCDILITGDRSSQAEEHLLDHFAVPEVDLLIAGHHGSAGSTGERLLQTVSPETVIISAGRNNPYGHPAEQTLARLSEYGCQVYRTDLHGTIIFRR